MTTPKAPPESASPYAGEPDAPPSPLPEPLRGLEEGTFTHYTVTQRFKAIARRVLEDTPGPAATRNRIERLMAEIPHHKLQPIHDPSAPDHLAWQRYLQPYLGMNWLEAPWFVVEAYFFRRLLEATAYYRRGRGYRKDPYQPQKHAAICSASQNLRRFDLSAILTGEAPLAPDGLASLLPHLLRLAVWSNQADLSMWPVGDQAQPPTPGREQISASLLVDHAQQAGEYLASLQGKEARVDFILDNVGLELTMDLVMADCLLRHGLASRVVFHVKPHPTYVSDATYEDVWTMVDALSQFAAEYPEYACLLPLHRRLLSYLHEGRLTLSTHYFWTSPLSGWEMPRDLRHTLSQSHLILSKGDANYRRWVGDRHWPDTTPLEAVLGYLPAPLLALRVLKAEVVIGLQPGQAEEVCARDAQWMYDGRWGVIQFVRPRA